MGGVKEFFFGKDATPSGPYQGPNFANQEEALNRLVMGNVMGQNPGAFGYNQPQGGWGAQANAQQGFQQAGQAISGQMTYQQPDIKFTQRNPYQFTQPQQISIPDLYKPQYEMAQRSIQDQGERTQEQLLNELNSRGMLTSGAANKGVMDLARDQNNRLADLSSQYSIEQGRMGLQEEQMRRQMDMERQYNQAAEIFRQQGASDAQAQFLAQQSLAGFGANLQGRQQATAEEQLANLMRRQPMEDLFRMWNQQTGQVGGTEGSDGFIPSLFSKASGDAAGLAMMAAMGGI